jgi:CDP-4-dehydro-6-deoxyglucose reductase
MNLQFHIPVVAGDPVSERLGGARTNTEIQITGPHGNFTLNEDSPRSVVFIAVNAGFGPVKSLIEHAMALDIAEQLGLYWITTPGNNHYQGNLCRSWDDALDNFGYCPMEATETRAVTDLIPEIVAELEALQELDFYVCAPAPLLENIETLLTASGVNRGHLQLEPVRETQSE